MAMTKMGGYSIAGTKNHIHKGVQDFPNFSGAFPKGVPGRGALLFSTQFPTTRCGAVNRMGKYLLLEVGPEFSERCTGTAGKCDEGVRAKHTVNGGNG